MPERWSPTLPDRLLPAGTLECVYCLLVSGADDFAVNFGVSAKQVPYHAGICHTCKRWPAANPMTADDELPFLGGVHV